MYICLVQDAMFFPAPDKNKPSNRKPAGSIYQPIGRVENGGITFYIVMEKNVPLYVDVRNVVKVLPVE